jgi:curved DNA-binding protein CbpA
MLPDYYAILGIDKDASYLEIKAAYRSLAKEHHPDKHGGDLSKEQIIKEINEAYEVLSNSDSRLSYDKRLSWQEEWQAHGYGQTYTSSSPSSPPPPTYAAPAQPYHYQSRGKRYGSTKYVYSKWTLMYGKIFVTLLIMTVVLLPVYLEYSFSNYFYNQGMAALKAEKYDQAERYFVRAMRDLGGSNTIAAIKGAEINLSQNSNFEALNFIKMGLRYAETTPQRARLYFLQGMANKNIRYANESRASFENALQYGYRHDSVYMFLAPILTYEIKDYQTAITTYDSLIKFYPTNYDHYLHRGFSQQKLNNHITAINDFNIFIEEKGINGSVLYLKGVSQLALSENDSACVNFKRAEDLGIRNARTFIELYCEPDSTEIEYPYANPF